MGRPIDVGSHSDKPRGRPRYKPERPTPEIPIAEFQEAQRDPIVKEFLENAKSKGEKLELEGKIHF